jgi:hypothetical protein
MAWIKKRIENTFLENITNIESPKKADLPSKGFSKTLDYAGNVRLKAS